MRVCCSCSPAADLARHRRAVRCAAPERRAGPGRSAPQSAIPAGGSGLSPGAAPRRRGPSPAALHHREGYYLYRQRFAFDADPGLLTAPVALPPGEPKHDEWFGDVQVYHAGVDIPLPLAPDRGGQIKVTYQGCADRGLCYPPETRTLDIAGPALATTAPGGHRAVPAQLDWHRILLAFLAGLGLTFTPCVLPMLPIVSAVVLAGKARPGRGLLLALAYVVPMALSFAALGALMGVFGAISICRRNCSRPGC